MLTCGWLKIINQVILDEKNVREKVIELKQGLDFIVIDTPPNFQTAALKSALLSDLVVIPCSPYQVL